MEKKKSVFEVLSAIDCKPFVRTKNGLSYLSWARAWGIVKHNYPEASYSVYENADGLNYHTDGRTCWVKTGVAIGGNEVVEYLPVMDLRNQSVGADRVTSVDVNKAIQRCLTKAIARHGLGLYIYEGEDEPVDHSPIDLKIMDCETRQELVTLWQRYPNMSENCKKLLSKRAKEIEERKEG